MIDKNKIEEIICNIMYHDGPDKHTDGSDVITNFILQLLSGKVEEIIKAFNESERYEMSPEMLNATGYYDFKKQFNLGDGL